MALDISSSMYAIDFQPNRITAAKEAAKEFIDNRPNDRIGLVVFAGDLYTMSHHPGSSSVAEDAGR